MNNDKRIGQVLGGWVIHEMIGEGGNAKVYRVTRADEVAAMKILFKTHWRNERLLRFRDEVEGMKKCQGLPGVLPLLDFSIPEQPTPDAPPWLLSPLAEPVDKIAGHGMTFIQAIELVRDVAVTLAAMHNRKMSHRDVKPNNLFRFEERWVVGDLGLT